MKTQELISKLLELSQNKDYEKMLIVLNENKSYKKTDNGQIIFRIVSDIVKIKMFRRIPKITIHNKNDYYKALYGCNYALAYSLYEKRSNNNNQAEKQLIITLLTNINKQIEECTKKQQLIINKEKFQRMKGKTPARLGSGRAGPRYKTLTMLRFRADHAAAQDAVFSQVPEDFAAKHGMTEVVTRCKDKDEYLTRPDHGRCFGQSGGGSHCSAPDQGFRGPVCP